MFLIPEEDQISRQLIELAQKAKVAVFIGLPGTGKSLLINHFYHLAKTIGKEAQVIQWDVARKAFETDHTNQIFPTSAGQVHPGVRLSAGQWLLDFLKNWNKINLDAKDKLLMIEAPLVGNRFSELIHKQQDQELEKYLSSEQVQFVLPIPSLDVRKKIELDRRAQVSESAKTWSGAKPSVMQQLWEDTLQIAKTLAITEYKGTEYDPIVYNDTYSHITRHRHLLTLTIDKIYTINIEDESSLHSLKNEIPTPKEAETLIQKIQTKYPADQLMETAIQDWYKS